jgi:TolB-like protein
VGLIVLNIVGGGKQLRAGDIQSIIILPFDNYTGDEQMDNMLSGMHALLVGDVGRISGVRVLGTKTSNVYKDLAISATEIASEVNVDAIVEASVMCFGDSVCMQFRLVRTSGEEEQLWIADYWEDKGQMPNLYNTITKQIADEIMIELTPEEERLLSKSRTVDREAYDDYLWGSFLLDDGSEESLYKALVYLNSAIE